MVKRLLSFWFLLCSLVSAQAQPVVGQTFYGSLLSEPGFQIPLPPSRWRATLLADHSTGGSPVRTIVLRSEDAGAVVPYILVRYSLQVGGNWGSACEDNHAAVFDADRHGTLGSQLLQKCSRQIATSLPVAATTHPWWKGLDRGIEPADRALQREPMIQSEFTVSLWKGAWLRVEPFTRTTLAGVLPTEMRDAVRTNRPLPLNESMRAWSRTYLTALEAAVNKRPFTPVPWPDVQASAAVADKIREMSPPTAAVAAAPTTLPNSREIDEKIRQMSSGGPLAAGARPAQQQVQQPVPVPAPQRPAQATAPAVPAAAGQNSVTPTTPPAPAVSAQDLARLSAEVARLRDELKARPPSPQPMARPEPPTPVAPSAVSARRLAFVIGNDNYQSVTKLQNARTDAKAMADMLTRVGYRVRIRLDLTERAMKDELRAFKAEVQGGDEVLFFFAGHGVQLAGANYLLPTDVRSDSEDQVRDDALPLQKVLDDLQDRKARFALAIVDACRDNPFKGAGRNIGTRGLAPTAAATGQMVMFSAGAGQQALDRLGERDREPNGLFTRVLLREMDKPGVSVDRVLRAVRTQVVDLARGVGHEQVPALYDQSIGEFFIRR